MSAVQLIDVSNASVYTKTVTGLQESTEYELQVLAYTSAGDGPNSSVQFVKTLKDGKSYIYIFFFFERSTQGDDLQLIYFSFLRSSRLN